MAVCKNCRYFDERTRSGYKGYCTWYKSYEDPDSMARGCTHYEAAGASGSGGCYLTSACVKARNLPDDCEELTVLRAFRDGYLASRERGQEEIAHYYAVAPRIVEAINARPDAASVWDELYTGMISKCVEMIRRHEPEAAYELYKRRSLELEAAYCH